MSETSLLHSIHVQDWKSFWTSEQNCLLLNPRLPAGARDWFEEAWQTHVEGRLSGHVGIVTSGSSGEQGRLILLSKQALLTSAKGANEHLRASASDVWLRTLPLFHVGGLSIHARSFLLGSTVYESRLKSWDAQSFYTELLASGATLLSLVPTQLFDLVLLGQRAPAQLRAVILGGGRLEPELRRKALQLGWPVLASYGFTECGSQVATVELTSMLEEEPVLKPLPHVQLRTGRDDRIEVQSQGLLTAQIRSQSGLTVYVDPKVDGWFSTEDRGQILEDGGLRVLGRTQDFIKVGGEGVSLLGLSERLERLRLETKFPGDVALLAARDERLGAKLVLLSTVNDLQPLLDRFNQESLPFERIRSFHFVNEIPRSSLGKLLRLDALTLVGLESLPNF